MSFKGFFAVIHQGFWWWSEGQQGKKGFQDRLCQSRSARNWSQDEREGERTSWGARVGVWWCLGVQGTCFTETSSPNLALWYQTFHSPQFSTSTRRRVVPPKKWHMQRVCQGWPLVYPHGLKRKWLHLGFVGSVKATRCNQVEVGESMSNLRKEKVVGNLSHHDALVWPYGIV